MGAPEQIIIPEVAPFEKPDSSTAMLRMVERAIFDPSFDAAKLAVLLDLQLKWEANEARKKFEIAFEQFKRHLPEIFRTKKVTIPTKDGKTIEYSHAELDKITPIITESLLAVGIVHYWKTGESVSAAGARTVVTCVLKGFGHTEDAATLSGPPDTSGSKSSNQAILSTTTSLQRYTLLAACGIAVKGTDNDGKTEGLPENTIMDYVAALRDASSLEELMKVCKECVEKANRADDTDAKERFRKVYEERKREIREHKQ